MLSPHQPAGKSLQHVHGIHWLKRDLLAVLKANLARMAIAVLLALFFVFVGSDSIIDVVRTPHFKTDFAVSAALSFLLLSYVQAVSVHLNKKYSWQGQFQKRIIQQLLLGLLVPAIILAVVISIYFFVVMEYKWSQVTFFYSEFPVSIVVIAAMNFFYTAWFFFTENKLQQTEMYQLQQQIFTLQQQQPQVHAAVNEQERATGESMISDDEDVTEPAQKIKTLVAVSGNKNVPIAAEQIAYFIKEGNFTKLMTFQSHFYLLNHTLDDLMNLLDEALFFRANRQVIINIKACHYFTNEENGKLALYLTPETEDEVIISQKRASLFKEWLHK